MYSCGTRTGVEVEAKRCESVEAQASVPESDCRWTFSPSRESNFVSGRLVSPLLRVISLVVIRPSVAGIRHVVVVDNLPATT